MRSEDLQWSDRYPAAELIKKYLSKNHKKKENPDTRADQRFKFSEMTWNSKDKIFIFLIDCMVYVTLNKDTYLTFTGMMSRY